MLASIVVNNHNYARFLRSAVDSALAQTYSNIEVIVVDDGSTDDSAIVIREYGDRVVPVFKECGGQASAVNVGVAHSRGDVIILLDSDDVLEPTIVERVVDAFTADPGVVWVLFRLEVIDADGTRTGVLRPPEHLPRRDGDLRRNIMAFPFDMVRTATSGNAFSSRVVKHILPIPEDVYFYGADWYVSPLVGLFGRCVFLDQIGVGYRVHGSNINWYERPSMTVDLKAIRRELRFMRTSSAAIQRFGRQLSLSSATSVVSVADVGTRMVSLKLDPAGHPIRGDTAARILRLGIIATLRRFDVRWPMKVLFIGWFTAMCLAPRSLANRLAEMWYFPARRRVLNPALTVLHVRGRAQSSPATRS